MSLRTRTGKFWTHLPFPSTVSQIQLNSTQSSPAMTINNINAEQNYYQHTIEHPLHHHQVQTYTEQPPSLPQTRYSRPFALIICVCCCFCGWLIFFAFETLEKRFKYNKGIASDIFSSSPPPMAPSQSGVTYRRSLPPILRRFLHLHQQPPDAPQSVLFSAFPSWKKDDGTSGWNVDSAMRDLAFAVSALTERLPPIPTAESETNPQKYRV